MGRVSERRALFLQSDPDYDPFVGIDVNEYLIEEWPQLTLKQRRSVWTICQSDEDFDFTGIYEQIDATVCLLAETDSTIDLSNVEFEDDVSCD